MAVAAVTVRNHKGEKSSLVTMGKIQDRIVIETEDQKYRIFVTEEGGLQISSESFENTTLSVIPVVSNVIKVKGV